MAEKIIRIRNYAFLIWKIFDTPTDKINLNIINNKILTGNSNSTASSYGIDDISDLNRGIYLVKATDDNSHSKTMKLIKQ